METAAATVTALRLQEMSGRGTGLPPWETEWVLFGPVPNEGTCSTWPGKLGFSPIGLEGATTIPDAAELNGQRYAARRRTSTGGRFDFTALFQHRETGCPIMFMLTSVTARRPALLPVSFSANWGTQWWVNGELVYETRMGNFGDWEQRQVQQFRAPLRAGENLFAVKVVAGSPANWVITLSAGKPGRITRRPPRHPVQVKVGSAVAAGGISQRDYVACGLRIEERPGPVVDAATVARRERTMAENGVEARWLGIVDHTGSPYGDSAFLPPGEYWHAENSERLRRQVAESHVRGMAVMTWFPGVHCKSAGARHPEWKSVPLPWPVAGSTHAGATELAGEAAYNLCPNSPYGEALIQFVLESIAAYGLDGFWFDGTCRGSGDRPVCACEHCRRRFREQEGIEFPGRADWADPAFRRWVAWQSRDYLDFWGRLAGRVRRAFPHARIVINHLHRLCHNWSAGIPLLPYAADVVAGTEAQDDPFVSAFHARLQRAYGKRDNEVWMGLHKLFTRNPNWPTEADPINRYFHHALASMTAGAMPSFGTPDPGEKLAATYPRLATLVNPRQNWTGGPSVPCIGLHLSEQAETFHFSRRADHGFPADYWFTLFGWHNLLGEKQLLTDLVFDDVLDPNRLSAFPVFVAPCSVALADAQVRCLEEYVRNGGVLVTGPHLGACDEWGEPAPAGRMLPLLGRPAAPAPVPDASLENPATDGELRRLGAGQIMVFSGNPGLSFHRLRNPRLASEVADLIRQAAPPRLEIMGPARLRVGLYQKPGQLVLHVQNFIAWSGIEQFPYPVLAAPPPARNVVVRLHGVPIRAARVVAGDGGRRILVLESDADTVFLRLPVLRWGTVLALDLG